VEVASETAGMEIDAYFDNFTAVKGSLVESDPVKAQAEFGEPAVRDADSPEVAYNDTDRLMNKPQRTANEVSVESKSFDRIVPGKWTMDLDTAKEMAAEKKLPILLNFTGSDWCGWCKLMEKDVFTKPEWEAYATNHLMMVFIDFPRDKSLVPDKYVQRNAELKTEYGIRGFPTFVLLDDDGKTELGRLGAGRNKTPESFQREVQDLLRFRAGEIEKTCSALSPEDQKRYRSLLEELSDKEEQLKATEQELQELFKRYGAIQEDIEKSKRELRRLSLRAQPEFADAALRYRLIEGEYTWHEAKMDAEDRGGHLATVTSPEEWEIICSLFDADFRQITTWLGATDEEEEGVWKWVTGEAWTFEAWNPGEPNNDYDGAEDYLHVWRYDEFPASQSWNDCAQDHSSGGYLLELEE
jgi:protein disulfide-isomerase